MGIDVYMRWPDQTEEEHKAQITGFSIHHGHTGYLREPYFRKGPSVIAALLPYDWDEETFEAPAAELRKNLPDALDALKERFEKNGWDIQEYPEAAKSFEDFVVLAEEKEKKHGKPVKISVSY